MDIAGQRFVITPAPPIPTALALDRRAGTSFAYPACSDDPNGPCKQMTKSSESCVKEFLTSNFYHEMWCLCTNDYYSRSSECHNDCRPTYVTVDTNMASIDMKLKSVECESYSIAMVSNDAFWSSVSAIKTSQAAKISNSTRASSTAGATAGRTLGSATKGVTVSGSETSGWSDRPTAAVQRSGGVVIAGRWKGLVAAVIVLALIPRFYEL